MSNDEFEEVCAERDVLHEKVSLMQTLLNDARAEVARNAVSRKQLDALSAERLVLLEQNRISKNMLETFGRQAEEQQVTAEFPTIFATTRNHHALRVIKSLCTA